LVSSERVRHPVAAGPGLESLPNSKVLELEKGVVWQGEESSKQEDDRYIPTLHHLLIDTKCSMGIVASNMRTDGLWTICENIQAATTGLTF